MGPLRCKVALKPSGVATTECLPPPFVLGCDEGRTRASMRTISWCREPQRLEALGADSRWDDRVCLDRHSRGQP